MLIYQIVIKPIGPSTPASDVPVVTDLGWWDPAIATVTSVEIKRVRDLLLMFTVHHIMNLSIVYNCILRRNKGSRIDYYNYICLSTLDCPRLIRR